MMLGIPGSSAPLTFGKYAGLSVTQLAFRDTDYFIWGVENGIFPGAHALVARMLYERITSIRIPPEFGATAVAEYVVQPGSGAFAGLQIRERAHVDDERRGGAIILDVIDLSVPRRLRHYDKSGMKIMQRDFKEIVFGSPSARLTRARIDSFFSDPDHFKPLRHE
jgi:hypothetical protein